MENIGKANNKAAERSGEDKISLENAKNDKLNMHRERASQTVGRDTNQDFIFFKSTLLQSVNTFMDVFHGVCTANPVDIKQLNKITGKLFFSMEHKISAILYLNAIYTSENFVAEHSLRVGLLANIFASWLGLDAQMTSDVTVAGYLHDFGMLQMPRDVITKEDFLTDEEYATLRNHPTTGSLMLLNKGVSSDIRKAVLCHHERYDGSGYPYGISGDQLSYMTNIISIVDVYDSMTSNRPYKPAKCPFAVIDFFEKEMLTKFHPGLLYTFLDNIPFLYSNVLVRLSNGEAAKVAFINKSHKSLPIVQLEADGSILDLSEKSGLTIESLI